MKTAVLFIFLLLSSIAGSAQHKASPATAGAIASRGDSNLTKSKPATKRHVFTIRREGYAGINGGGGWCGFADFKKDKDKDSLYRPAPTETFYVALPAPYNFTKATIGTYKVETNTARKINDTLLAFTKNKGQDMQSRWFVAEHMVKGKIKTLRVRLSRCTMTSDAENNKVFTICEHCLEPVEKANNKGFFAWIGRLFG